MANYLTCVPAANLTYRVTLGGSVVKDTNNSEWGTGVIIPTASGSYTVQARRGSTIATPGVTIQINVFRPDIEEVTP